MSQLIKKRIFVFVSFFLGVFYFLAIINMAHEPNTVFLGLPILGFACLSFLLELYCKKKFSSFKFAQYVAFGLYYSSLFFYLPYYTSELEKSGFAVLLLPIYPIASFVISIFGGIVVKLLTTVSRKKD